MAHGSSIEWTEATWNPVVGCSKVSRGCEHCYAERMACRLASMAASDKATGRNPGRKANYSLVVDAASRRWNGEVYVDEGAIQDPYSWSSPRLVFVNSMGDLFHEKTPVATVKAVFKVMADCPQHTFQVLTKRPQIARELSSLLPWPSNIWLGTSVEDVHAVHRVGELVGTSAQIKFLSLEPLLGEIPKISLDRINWVIVGGESGPGARPMDGDWVRSVRNQCVRANVPFFFKQWGGANKKKKGRVLDGRVWEEMPKVGEQRKPGA